MEQDLSPASGRFFSAILMVCTLLSVQGLRAEESPAYLEAISKRAEKIVVKLEVEDQGARERVHGRIMDQYRWLHREHNDQDTEIESIEGEQKEERILSVRKATDKKVHERHIEYLGLLAKDLTPTQVDAVKDGMTYGVVQVTFKAYTKMLPELTDEQKDYIKEQLEEAREIAMDAGSSKEKHKWFGKYKGRINNYLSKAGYDLKAASKRAEGKQ